jgi:hypothetical protein
VDKEILPMNYNEQEQRRLAEQAAARKKFYESLTPRHEQATKTLAETTLGELRKSLSRERAKAGRGGDRSK